MAVPNRPCWRRAQRHRRSRGLGASRRGREDQSDSIKSAPIADEWGNQFHFGEGKSGTLNVIVIYALLGLTSLHLTILYAAISSTRNYSKNVKLASTIQLYYVAQPTRRQCAKCRCLIVPTVEIVYRNYKRQTERSTRSGREIS